MATIFHIALASEWDAALVGGSYTTSTLGRSLAEEGFIHASRADQWTGVRDRFYAGVTEPLVLLHIDTDLLDVPVVDEVPAPGMTETFPHIYGRLPTSAVVKAIPLGDRAATEPPRATEPATPTAQPQRQAGGESFSRTYFREMFFNMAVLCVVIGASGLGIVLGLAMGGDRAPGVGGAVGLAVGAAVAVWLYRRRHARTTSSGA